MSSLFLLVALVVLGLRLVAWFMAWWRGRQLKVTSVMVPEPGTPLRVPPSRGPDPAVVEGVASLPWDAQSELLRSLERMEGDLAALRNEVERMREQVRRSSRGPGTPQH
jgi:HAMP domain-containing protein